MAATPDTVHWRGVHHLALVTPDMDATVRFWHGVLDARLISHDRHPYVPALLLRGRAGQHDRLLRVHGTAPRVLRQAGRRSLREGAAVRPPVDQPARRGRAAATARPAQEPRVRGHRRRRPRLPALDLLQRQQRHRPRGVVVDPRPDRAPGRLRRRAAVLRRRPGAGRAGAARAGRARPHRRDPPRRQDHRRPRGRPLPDEPDGRSRRVIDTIPALLLRAAERDPDGVWLRTDDGQLTFAGAVGCQVARVAGAAWRERAWPRRPGGGHARGTRRRTSCAGSPSRRWARSPCRPTRRAATAELAGLVGQVRPRLVVTDAGGRRALDRGLGDGRPAAAGAGLRTSRPTTWPC